MKKWFEIKNLADKAEIWIYEEIGVDWWTGDGKTAKQFQKELSAIKATQIDLHINSIGGEVFDGLAIYNLLKQHPAAVTTYIDGIAASIASVIALSGNKIYMAENALFMIHNPIGGVWGTAIEMRKFADELEIVGGSIAKAYIAKTGKTEKEIAALMADETWMSAEEAIENGFVDDMTERMDMAACAKFIPAMAKANFKNIPENLSGSKQPPDNERDLESVLRDAGYTRKEAKSIIADGFKGVLRDAEQPKDATEVPETLRDAEQPKPPKKDRAHDLLIRAEVIAPSNYQEVT